MSKLKYIKPAAETIQLTAEDIITESIVLKTTVNGVGAAADAAISYDTWFNESSNGKITLK